MASVRVTNCTVDDGEVMANNNMSAFWGDPNWRYVWKHSTLPRVIEAASARGANNLLKNRDVLRHFKCVDETTGDLVGYIRWKLPDSRCKQTDGSPVWPEGQTPDVSAWEWARIKARAASANWNPNATNPDDNLDEPLTKKKHELMAKKEYLLLDYVAVHPEHQHKGYGTVLVSHGIQKAEELGMDVFVLAFEGGFRLYDNTGFVELWSIVQDATSVGGTDRYACRLMEYTVNNSGVDDAATIVQDSST